jgi:hypothetical protein
MDTGRKIALVIGVDESPLARDTIPSLKAPSTVAQQLAEILQTDPCGFEIHGQQAIVGADATAVAIQDLILDYVHTLGPNDTLLLSFCGHGVPETVDSGARDIFLATYDYHAGRVKHNPERYLSMRWLRDKALLSPSVGRIILLLDCCYAGFIGDVQHDPRIADLRAELEVLLDIGRPVQRTPKAPRTAFTRVAITSALPWKPSYEEETSTLFSAALFSGLLGNREALRSDGSVTIDSLREFIRLRLGTQQVCGRYGPDHDVVVLAQYPAPVEQLTAEALQHIQHAQQQRAHEDRLRYLHALCIDHSGFMNDRLSSFVGRAAELAAVRQEITRKIPTGGYVTITGQAGQGKSSLIAKLISAYSEGRPTHHFIPFISGPDHQVILLRDIMAQLIMKYDLPDFYVASESRPSLKGYFPKLLADVHVKGQHEIIFIDGLDQIEAEQSGVRDLSFLPTNPPPGIVFVLGTRPNDALKPLELLKPHDEYRLPPLSRSDFDLILDHRNVHLDRHFADQFYLTMQQNALYLDLVAAELATCGIESIEAIISRINDNHENIFSLTMDRLKRHSLEWRTVIKPILGTLLAVREPFSTRALRSVLSLDDEQVRTGLMRLGGLVAQDSEGRYFLYHLKFQDYLRQDPAKPEKDYVFALDEEEVWHQSLATWCGGADAASIEQIWVDARYPAGENERRLYGRHHLITHIFLSKNWDQLWSVVDAGIYGKAKLRDDPSTRSYAQDLDLARQAATQDQWDLSTAISHLPRLWRYSLLRSSLSSQANNCPPKLFRIMVAAHREREAIGMAELMTDPAKKIEALLEIGKSLIQDRSLVDDGRQILIRASEVAQTDVAPQDTHATYLDIVGACHEVGQSSIAATVIERIPVSLELGAPLQARFLADRLFLSILLGLQDLARATWSMVKDFFAPPVHMEPLEFTTSISLFLSILSGKQVLMMKYFRFPQGLAGSLADSDAIDIYIEGGQVYELVYIIANEFIEKTNQHYFECKYSDQLAEDVRVKKSRYAGQVNEVVLLLSNFDFISSIGRDLEGKLYLREEFLTEKSDYLLRLIQESIDIELTIDDGYELNDMKMYQNSTHYQRYGRTYEERFSDLLKDGYYEFHLLAIDSYNNRNVKINSTLDFLKYLICYDSANIVNIFGYIHDIVTRVYMLKMLANQLIDNDCQLILITLTQELSKDIIEINDYFTKLICYATMAELMYDCKDISASRMLLDTSTDQLLEIEQFDQKMNGLFITIRLRQRMGLLIPFSDQENEDDTDHDHIIREFISHYMDDENTAILIWKFIVNGYLELGNYTEAEQIASSPANIEMRDQSWKMISEHMSRCSYDLRAIAAINKISDENISVEALFNVIDNLNILDSKYISQIYEFIPLLDNWKIRLLAILLMFMDVNNIDFVVNSAKEIEVNKNSKDEIWQFFAAIMISNRNPATRSIIPHIEDAYNRTYAWEQYVTAMVDVRCFDQARAAIAQYEKGDDRDDAWIKYIETLLEALLFDEACAVIPEIVDVEIRDDAWENYVKAVLEAAVFDDPQSAESQIEDADEPDHIRPKIVDSMLVSKARAVIPQIEDADDRDDAWEQFVDTVLEASLFDEARTAIPQIQNADDRDDAWEKFLDGVLKIRLFSEAHAAILYIKDVDDRDDAWEEYVDALLEAGLFDEACAAIPSILDQDDRDDAWEKCAKALGENREFKRTFDVIPQIHDLNDQNNAWRIMAIQIIEHSDYSYEDILRILSSMTDIDDQSIILSIFIDKGVFQVEQIDSLFSAVLSSLRSTSNLSSFVELLVYIINDTRLLESIDIIYLKEMVYGYINRMNGNEYIHYLTKLIVSPLLIEDAGLIGSMIEEFMENRNDLSMEEEIVRNIWAVKCCKTIGDSGRAIAYINRLVIIFERVLDLIFGDEIDKSIGEFPVFMIHHSYIFGDYDGFNRNMRKYENMLNEYNEEDLLFIYVHIGEYDKAISILDRHKYNEDEDSGNIQIALPSKSIDLSVYEALDIYLECLEINIDFEDSDYLEIEKKIMDLIDGSQSLNEEEIDILFKISKYFYYSSDLHIYKGFWDLSMCVIFLKNMLNHPLDNIIKFTLESGEKVIGVNILYAISYGLIHNHRYEEAAIVDTAINMLRQQKSEAKQPHRPKLPDLEPHIRRIDQPLKPADSPHEGVWQQDLTGSSRWRRGQRKRSDTSSNVRRKLVPPRQPRFRPYDEGSSWQEDLLGDSNWRSARRSEGSSWQEDLLGDSNWRSRPRRSTLSTLKVTRPSRFWLEHDLHGAAPILLFMAALIRHRRFDQLFNHLRLFNATKVSVIVAVSIRSVLKTGDIQTFLSELGKSDLSLGISIELMMQILQFHIEHDSSVDLVGIATMYETHLAACQDDINVVIWNATLALMAQQRHYDQAFDLLDRIVPEDDRLHSLWTIVLESHHNGDHDQTRRGMQLLGQGAMQFSKMTRYPSDREELFDYLTDDISYTPPQNVRGWRQRRRFNPYDDNAGPRPPRFNPYDDNVGLGPPRFNPYDDDVGPRTRTRRIDQYNQPAGKKDTVALHTAFSQGDMDQAISLVLAMLAKNQDTETWSKLVEELHARKATAKLVKFLQQAWLRAQTKGEVFDRLTLAAPLMRQHPAMVREVLDALHWVEENLKW